MISESHVLTTARCRCTKGETVSTIKVLVGNVNSGTRVAISAISDVPLFDSTTWKNDFSILTLAEPVTFTDTVSPACLPSDVSQDYAGQEATVIGWGYTPSRPSVLQKANVRVISNKDCRNGWSHIPDDIGGCVSLPLTST